MSIDFDKYIKERVVYYDPECTQNEVLSKLYHNEWDIIAVRDSIIVKKSKQVPLMQRDVITNIKSEDSLLFYHIDGNIFPIRDDTRFITALTPFKPVIIRAESINKHVRITFTRLMIRNELIDELQKNLVYDGPLSYLSGEIF